MINTPHTAPASAAATKEDTSRDNKSNNNNKNKYTKILISYPFGVFIHLALVVDSQDQKCRLQTSLSLSKDIATIPQNTQRQVLHTQQQVLEALALN